jgi:lipoprotein-anchoring transpeptidase ErfK/SrfK
MESVKFRQLTLTLNRRTLLASAAMVGADCLVGCTNSPLKVAEVSKVDTAFRRKEVQYVTREAAGTIVVQPGQHYLYFVLGAGRAIRYGVGVGREGYGWSGLAKIHSKQEWPDWYPTEDYIQTHPGIRSDLTELQSGFGVVGGPDNPLGARALYLWQDGKDTLYRIHGTNEPWTIGTNVSAGCIRLTNGDVIDLYSRTPVGTKVVVLPSNVG